MKKKPKPKKVYVIYRDNSLFAEVLSRLRLPGCAVEPHVAPSGSDFGKHLPMVEQIHGGTPPYGSHIFIDQTMLEAARSVWGAEFTLENPRVHRLDLFLGRCLLSALGTDEYQAHQLIFRALNPKGLITVIVADHLSDHPITRQREGRTRFFVEPKNIADLLGLHYTSSPATWRSVPDLGYLPKPSEEQVFVVVDRHCLPTDPLGGPLELRPRLLGHPYMVLPLETAVLQVQNHTQLSRLLPQLRQKVEETIAKIIV